jgi:hypothetical protein
MPPKLRHFSMLAIVVLAGAALMIAASPTPSSGAVLVNMSAAYKPRPWAPGGDAEVAAPFSIPGPGIVKMTWTVENYQSAGYTMNWPVGFRKQGTTGGGPFPYARIISSRTLSNGKEVATPLDGSVAVYEVTGEVRDKLEGWEAVIHAVSSPGSWELRQQYGQKTSIVMEFDVGNGTSKPPLPGKQTIEVPATGDAYVSFLDNQRDTNFGRHAQLGTYSSTCNNWTAVSYLEFSFAPLPKSGIVKATIVLEGHASHNKSCGAPWPADPVFAVRQVTSGWVEGSITWNRQPAFDSAIISTATLKGLRGVSGADVTSVLSFDVTDLYRRWIESGTPNFGVRLSQENAICQNCTLAYFTSRHGGVAPRLVVTGDPPPSGIR